MLVDQPSKLPTNKMTLAALVGPAAAEVWARFMAENAPSLSGDAMSMLIGSLAALSVAYWVKDRANVRFDGAGREN